MIPKTKKCVDDIDKFIKENHFDECGIVYCLSRMDCEKVAERLQVGFLSLFIYLKLLQLDAINNNMNMQIVKKKNQLSTTNALGSPIPNPFFPMEFIRLEITEIKFIHSHKSKMSQKRRTI